MEPEIFYNYRISYDPEIPENYIQITGQHARIRPGSFKTFVKGVVNVYVAVYLPKFILN
jgi:hypothetical protein